MESTTPAGVLSPASRLILTHTTRFVRALPGSDARRETFSMVNITKQSASSASKRREILLAIEHERARIAQDLHDDICQILTGVSCLVQVSASNLAKQNPRESDRLLEINKRVIDAMNGARAICHDLHPAQAPRTTIRETLLELARLSRARYPVKIRARMPGRATRLPAHTPRQQLLVFRIAQEAICNAIRHGRATEITLSLSATAAGKQLLLCVEDNGLGLQPRKQSPDGLGMRIMRCRADELGGELAIAANPRPQKGARMQLIYFPSPAPPSPRHTQI